MQVRRTIITLAAAATLTFANTAPACAADGRKVIINTENLAKLSAEDQEQVKAIAARMTELLETDHRNASKEERKALRSEVRALKASMEMYNERGGGSVVYISTAGVIIILLVLIILL